MGASITRASCLAGAGALILCATPAVAHQPLALSYSLEVRSDLVPVTVPNDVQCGIAVWSGSITACQDRSLADAADRVREKMYVEVRPVVPPQSSEMHSADAPASTAGTQEFALRGTSVQENRYGRSGVARETLIGSTRTADLLLRFGSKHRFRSNDESGPDWYRFNDTTYQTHLHNNGHKALGLELLVPFQ